SPTAIAIAKRSFNMDTAHQAGIAGMGMYALQLYYDTEGSREGVNALKETRQPEFRKSYKSGRYSMTKNPYITEDLEFLAETAEKFAQKYIAPGFLERDQSRVFDRDLVKKMGEMGFIAPELPEQYGGQGMGRLAAGIIHEAVAKA